MENKKYKIRYLSTFEQDLMDTAMYIAEVIKNKEAALRLIDDVEGAIERRAKNPTAFEPYHSKHPRKDTYYRIYIRKYIVFYVVIDDVMEVRRMVYSARDLDEQL